MFVINQEKIDETFKAEEWEREYEEFCSLVAKLLCEKPDESTLTEENIEFMKSYLDTEYEYCKMAEIDIDTIREFGYLPAITKIVSNDPVTIIWFADGSEVRVTNTSGKAFDARQGVYLALLKKALGGKHIQHLFKLLDEVIEPASDCCRACIADH